MEHATELFSPGCGTIGPPLLRRVLRLLLILTALARRPCFGVIPGTGERTDKIVYSLVQAPGEGGVRRVKRDVYFTGTFRETEADIATTVRSEFQRNVAEGLRGFRALRKDVLTRGRRWRCLTAF